MNTIRVSNILGLDQARCFVWLDIGQTCCKDNQQATKVATRGLKIKAPIMLAAVIKYPSLLLVQPRKTCPCLTERLLIGHKESNKKKKKTTVIKLSGP